MPHSFDSQLPAGLDLKENWQNYPKGESIYSYADFPRSNTAKSERSKRRYSSIKSIGPDREGELSDSSKGKPSAKSRRRRIRSRTRSRSRSRCDDREKTSWPRRESTPYYEGTPRDRGCPDTDSWRPDTYPRRGTPYRPGDTPSVRGVLSTDSYRPPQVLPPRTNQDRDTRSQLEDALETTWQRLIREASAESGFGMPRITSTFRQSPSIDQVLCSSSNTAFDSHTQYQEAESSGDRGVSSQHSSGSLPEHYEDDNSSSTSRISQPAEPCSSVLEATYYATTSIGDSPRILGNQEIAPFSPIQSSNPDSYPFEYTSDCALLNKEAAFCSHSISDVDESCDSDRPRSYTPVISEPELRLNQFMQKYRRYVDELPSKPLSPKFRIPICSPPEDDVEFELGPTAAQKAKKFREDTRRWWYKVVEPSASVVGPDVLSEDELVGNFTTYLM